MSDGSLRREEEVEGNDEIDDIMKKFERKMDYLVKMQHIATIRLAIHIIVIESHN